MRHNRLLNSLNLRHGMFFFFLCAIGFKSQAQEGLIYSPCAGPDALILDPNADGYISKNAIPFPIGILDESDSFEIEGFKPVPNFGVEPSGDPTFGLDCGETDLVDNPNQSGRALYYKVFDPDPNVANDEWLIFRMRIGSTIPGPYGFSVLFDTDLNIGLSDPNTIFGNPGFEREVVYGLDLPNNGLLILDVDGTAVGNVLHTFLPQERDQRAFAINTPCGMGPAFYDFMVKFSELGITRNDLVRIAWASTINPATALDNNADDVGGIDDDLFVSADSKFETLIGGQTPFAFDPQDLTPPVISTQNLTAYLDASGSVLIDAALIDNGTFDAGSGLDTFFLDRDFFNCPDTGENLVFFYAYDLDGNYDSAQVTITILDTLKPVVNVNNITAYLDASGQVTINSGQVNNGSFDNCGIVAMDITQSNFSCSDIGINNVTFILTDHSGNQDSATFQVTVEDTIAPSLFLVMDTLHIGIDSTVAVDPSAIIALVSDNCGIQDTILSTNLYTLSDTGWNNITVTITDANGNQIQQVTQIFVSATGDSDGDGIPDHIEGLGDFDNDGIPNYLDPDSDGDGILDTTETAFDADGDGAPNFLDLDSDGDGILDSVETEADQDGDGTPNYLDLDSDDDGILDSVETDDDEDGDGTPNFLDLDSDGDGISDEIETDNDEDGDGTPNFLDLDSDGDGILDEIETDADEDGDGTPNFLDLDSDGDTIDDEIETDADEDGDGIPNFLDLDSDGDTLDDEFEFTEGNNIGTLDPDGDGIPTYLDLDSDGDGIPDEVEGTKDTDKDGVPDFLDLDSDGDERLDKDEYKLDCNKDGVSDHLQILPCELFLSEGISPNGDGINDKFHILGLNNFLVGELIIFDELGNVVYQNFTYDNEWQGQVNKGSAKVDSDGLLPTGTYYYLLKMRSPYAHTFKGFIYVAK